jgi:predicted homoserine dehydrogenase-like protein
MAEDPNVPRARPEFTDEELKAIGENAEMLKPWLTGDQILRSTLAIAFALGLIAHVVGYVLRLSAVGEPLRLVADLVYALGGALWTGVVVVGFVQVFPEVKRRQLKRALDAVEALKRDKDRA